MKTFLRARVTFKAAAPTNLASAKMVDKVSVSNSSSSHTQNHLTLKGRVNLGSFYTPAKYVAQIASWLLAHGIGKGWTIADLSCGYGAFFELQEIVELSECRFVGNDIDHEAIEKAKDFFPNVEWRESNALADVTRQHFGFKENERIVIVGNPPYNDVTSQINQNFKTKTAAIDQDIKTRDLGMSSLLSYNKLRADYVAVLHPLSYLIKKNNFLAAKNFFANYTMLEHIVFSSQEFANTSKCSSFPVIAALYKRTEGQGLSYPQIREMVFRTVEGNAFSIGQFDYVTDEIAKYPGDKRFTPEILFYTMRDINALMRCRTFIKERIANAIDVDPEKLAYYCYIDCFKRYASIPYWMGNFNVPYDKVTFPDIENEVVIDAKFHHPEIFGGSQPPAEEAIAKIRQYIDSLMQRP